MLHYQHITNTFLNSEGSGSMNSMKFVTDEDGHPSIPTASAEGASKTSTSSGARAKQFVYEERLKKFMTEHGVGGRHFSFDLSCHSVTEAAKAAQADPADFVKNVCMIGPAGELIVAIVNGKDSASRSKVQKALGLSGEVRNATPEEVTSRTGYPCGGTPSFGFEAVFLIDPKVFERPFIYTGGGSEYSLVQITPLAMQAANNAIIGKRIRG